MYLTFLKPIVDKLLALTLLVLSGPLLVIISIVQFVMYRKIFFVQPRPGKNGKLFRLYKFRSMTDADHNDDPSRLTSFGVFLRKTSLDELPQLINILKGEMSIVGPRPLLPEYLSLYSDKHRVRHDVLPGLTGLAQINGRNGISWERRLDLDREYVLNVSLRYDFKILWETIVLMFQEGSLEHQLMPKFEGLNNK